MSFGRSLYQFLLSSSQAYAKWDLEVSTSIIKNRKKMLFLLALCAAGGVSAKLYLDRVNGRNQSDSPSQGRTGARPRKLHQPPSDVAGNDYFFGEEERSDK